jgi:hypothetical protein
VLPATTDEAATKLAAILGDFRNVTHLYEIRTKSSGLVRFEPHRWHDEQRRFDQERTGRDIVVKARQIGMTTLELARGYWESSTRESHNTLVVGHDTELVEKLLVTVKLFHESMRKLGLAPKTLMDNARTLAFSELASSIAVTEAGATERVAMKKGRSTTINRLHATEVAFWAMPHDTMTGLLGAMPDDGEVLIESTPNGAGGYFYELVQEAAGGRGPYKLHFYPWWQHRLYRNPLPLDDARPRDDWEARLREYGCDDSQIQWWRFQVVRLGLEKALQEYPIDLATCFRFSGRGYLDPMVLDALAGRIRAPVRVLDIRGFKVRIYEEPGLPSTSRYIIGADTAEGVGNDHNAVTIIDARSGHVVAAGSSDRLAPGDFGLVLSDLGRQYRDALVVPERNNHGAATLRALDAEARYSRIYKHADDRLGFPTNSATRPVLWEDLRMAVAEGSAWTPDSEMLAELRTLVIDTDGKPRAMGKGTEHGSRDDLFVSWAIAWQVRGRPVQLEAHVGRPRVTAGLGKYY